MTGVNEFIQAEREDMKFFIDTLSNNWTSAKERIIELEFQIETENKLIEGLENTNNMYLVLIYYFIILLFSFIFVFILFYFIFFKKNRKNKKNKRKIKILEQRKQE